MQIIRKCDKCGCDRLLIYQKNDFDKSIFEASRVALYCRKCTAWLGWVPRADREEYLKFCEIAQNFNDKRKVKHLLTVEEKMQKIDQNWHKKYAYRTRVLNELCRNYKNVIRDKVLVPMRDVWSFIMKIESEINKNN